MEWWVFFLSNNGTDDYGFSALPGGYGKFYGIINFEDSGIAGYWKTATNYATVSGGDNYHYRAAYSFGIYYNNGYSPHCVQFNSFAFGNETKKILESIRCIAN